MYNPPNKKHARNAEVMKLHAQGLMYRQIATLMGISSGRVGILVRRERNRGQDGAVRPYEQQGIGISLKNKV